MSTTRNRRVGTLTLGITLIGMGLLFLLHLFLPGIITYSLIFRSWPIILILLGVEVLLAYAANKEEKMKYDGWAVFLMIGMIFLAAVMAGCQVLIDSGLVEYHITL